LSDALRLAVSAIETSSVPIPDKPFAVATIHRFENIYSKGSLERIVRILERIAKEQHLLVILHKPTERKLRGFGYYERLAQNPNIELRQRYDYFRFIKLITNAEFVISDGGSNQEECYYLGKPVLLLRMTTERHEGLSTNCTLSRYESEVIDSFLKDYKQKECPPTPLPMRPSQIIVEHCQPFA
jgi:UDP-N-acetylglucosamine 2-epimerase (non-hydrolysing)